MVSFTVVSKFSISYTKTVDHLHTYHILIRLLWSGRNFMIKIELFYSIVIW